MHLIYYDTETTGIRSEKDKIIEIAAYNPVKDTSFVQLVNPKCLIPAEATAIHHITNEMVATAEDFSVVGAQFAEFCGEEAVLIAHNNDAFDQQFLNQEALRHNITWPASWQFCDSLKWARKYRPDLPRHSLQFLREVYQIQANQAHRALDDVIVLHKVFQLMIDDLSVSTVLELLKKKKELTVMPFGKHQGTPFKQLPQDYIRWLAGSGAFDKPENSDLKAAFVKVGLLTS